MHLTFAFINMISICPLCLLDLIGRQRAMKEAAAWEPLATLPPPVARFAAWVLGNAMRETAPLEELRDHTASLFLAVHQVCKAGCASNTVFLALHPLHLLERDKSLCLCLCRCHVQELGLSLPCPAGVPGKP